MDTISYKFKYAVLCSIIFPTIAYLHFYTADLQYSFSKSIIPFFIGLLFGFFLGLMKDRWTSINRRLEQMVHLRTDELKKKMKELDSSQKRVKVLKTLLPVCAHCKNIRGNNGDWTKIENYLQNHTGHSFSSNLCPNCNQKYHPDLAPLLSSER